MAPLSDESKRKIGEKNRVNMLGKKATIETKRKMSESHKEIMKSESYRKHLSNKLVGIKRSDEHKEKLRFANQGSKSSLAKYNEDLIEKIRIDYMKGMKPLKLSEKYNINKGTLKHIIHNRTWKHVIPDGWEEFLVNMSR